MKVLFKGLKKHMPDNETALIHLFTVNHKFVEEYFSTKMWCTLRCVSKGLYFMLMEPIMDKLRAKQRAHYREMRHRLILYRCMVDVSIMGCGKTFTTSAIAKSLNLDLVVFGPYSSQSTWNQAAAHFGITVEFHSYSEFQRKKKPYLTAVEDPMEWEDAKLLPDCHEQKALSLTIDPSWIARIKKPILLVFDESHFLKNVSKRSKSATILVRSLLAWSSGYVICLSATPFDKPEHTCRLARVLGILKAQELAVMNPFTRNLRYTGLQEIIDYAQQLTPMEIPRFYGAQASTKTAYFCMTHMIKPKLFLSMPAHSLPFIADTKNHFGHLEGNNLETVKQGVNLLRRAIQAFMLGQQFGGEAMGSVSGGLRMIEIGKVPLFVQNAQRVLRDYPTAKVTLMFNYTASLKLAEEHLTMHNPLVIHGPTSKVKRPKLLHFFQQPDCKHRLLICNLSVLAQGVDLDDQHGAFPRYAFISPSYHIIALHQASGRFSRTETKSKPIIRFLYVAEVSSEMKLLETLARKSKVIKSGLTYQVKLPGDYPEEYEID